MLCQIFSKLRQGHYSHVTCATVRHPNPAIYHYILVSGAVLAVILITTVVSHISDKY
jgi:hypothetical protein